MKGSEDVIAPGAARAASYAGGDRPVRGLQMRMDGRMQQAEFGARTPAIPGRAEVEQAVAEARRQFARTLSCWASDMLALRHVGTSRPTMEARRVHGTSWRRAA